MGVKRSVFGCVNAGPTDKRNQHTAAPVFGLARCTMKTLFSLSLLPLALADLYMHNPRGSNNKLNEVSNNAQNQNRLFDSQNNAAGALTARREPSLTERAWERKGPASARSAVFGLISLNNPSETLRRRRSTAPCT